MSFSHAQYERSLLETYRVLEEEALRDLSVKECLALEIEIIHSSLALCNEGLLDDRAHWMGRLKEYMIYQMP